VDYSIWSVMEQRVYQEHIQNTDELRQRLLMSRMNWSSRSLTMLSTSREIVWQPVCEKRVDILSTHSKTVHLNSLALGQCPKSAWPYILQFRRYRGKSGLTSHFTPTCWVRVKLTVAYCTCWAQLSSGPWQSMHRSNRCTRIASWGDWQVTSCEANPDMIWLEAVIWLSLYKLRLVVGGSTHRGGWHVVHVS